MPEYGPGSRRPMPLGAHIQGAIKALPEVDFESTFQVEHGFAEADHAKVHTAILAHHARLLERIAREAFDKTHPVNEYLSTQGECVQPMEIMANYRIPERIETITVGLPAGTTGAIVKLADCWMPIYGGPALQQAQTFQLLGLGIILNEDDDRLLTITPQPTQGPCHFSLSGWADELYG